MKSFVRTISKISGHKNILRQSPIRQVCCIKHLLHGGFFNTHRKKSTKVLAGGIHIDVAVPLSNNSWDRSSCVSFAFIKGRKGRPWRKSLSTALITSKGNEIIKKVKQIGKSTGMIEEECLVLSSYVYVQERTGDIMFRITEVS